MCTANQKGKGFTKADIHNQEHERWNRRSFLQALGLAGGGSMLLANANITASVPSRLTKAISEASTDRILVLIRLKGGNDGLNTIIPIYDYDVYANARPTLRYEEKSLYKLDNDFGIPPAMTDLQSLWGDGSMKVVHGVGYENQDLSHFKSSNIWASTDLEEIEDSGWFGRYFEDLYPDFLVNPPEIPAAIQIGSIGNLIFDGQGVSNYALTVANPQQLESIGKNGTLHSMNDLPDCTYGDRLAYLRSVTNNTFTYATTIFEAYNKGKNIAEYSDNGIGKQLSIVARMIKGNLGTKVYMVSLDGFDTHANQKDKHQELWQEISKNVKLFYEDLKDFGIENDVLSMTISEFGRRVEENGSQGTDHGQAAPIFFFGPAIEDNGFVGQHPSLSDLDRVGNMKYSVDFREIYATVMKEWLCIDGTAVDEALLNTAFPLRNIGFSCSGKEIVEETEQETTGQEQNSQEEQTINAGEILPSKFSIQTRYEDGDTILNISKPNTSHVNITLYSLTGERVKEVKNELMTPGEYPINISKEIREANQGVYIYRVLNGKKAHSGKLYL